MKPLEAIESGHTLKQVMLAIEKEILILLFLKYKKNIRSVAHQCVITETCLRTKMKRLEISLDKI